tara:strand:+ start:74 stop:289 length:216 start_codon:yes stop_codon:yes gene_type:complete
MSKYKFTLEFELEIDLKNTIFANDEELNANTLDNYWFFWFSENANKDLKDFFKEYDTTLTDYTIKNIAEKI